MRFCLHPQINEVHVAVTSVSPCTQPFKTIWKRWASKLPIVTRLSHRAFTTPAPHKAETTQPHTIYNKMYKTSTQENLPLRDIFLLRAQYCLKITSYRIRTYFRLTLFLRCRSRQVLNQWRQVLDGIA